MNTAAAARTARPKVRPNRTFSRLLVTDPWASVEASRGAEARGARREPRTRRDSSAQPRKGGGEGIKGSGDGDCGLRLNVSVVVAIVS
jgi:hypothetical protein